MSDKLEIKKQKYEVILKHIESLCDALVEMNDRIAALEAKDDARREADKTEA